MEPNDRLMEILHDAKKLAQEYRTFTVPTTTSTAAKRPKTLREA